MTWISFPSYWPFVRGIYGPPVDSLPKPITRGSNVFVRRAGLLWSQQDFEWRWSVPLFKCLTVLEFSFILFHLCLLITFFQLYNELCAHCNILDIYLSWNLNFVNYVLFYMKLLNYLFFSMFGSVLESCELTGVCLLLPWLIKWKYGSLF